MNKNKKIPTRFHIGTQKAGSTFLYNLLKSHPDVSLSSQSEIHYYYKYFDRGADWYDGLFETEGVRIDTSPKYFMNGETVAPKIKEACGDDARILLILRNPIDLINSHYQMHVISGHFYTHTKLYPVVPKDLIDCIQRYPTYLRQSLYYQQIQVWLKYFNSSQIKVFIFEEFIKDVDKHMEELLNFWDLPEQKLVAPITSKNSMLKNRFLFVLRGKIMNVPVLKSFLQKNYFSNWIYDTYLTKKSSSAISECQRKELALLLKKDVCDFERIINKKIKIWKDFSNDK